MFTTSSRKLLNALGNAMIFAEPKPGDFRPHIAGIRIRVNWNVLDATGIDAYVIGQGRVSGTNLMGRNPAALVHVKELKPVVAALKKDRGEAAVDFTDAAVIFTVAGEVLEVPVMDGLDKWRGYDSMFTYSSGHVKTPGFAVFDPALLAKLGKLKDYEEASTRVERNHDCAVALGLNAFPGKPAMVTFGPDFRIVVATKAARAIPAELANMGGDSWFLATAR